MSDNSQFFDKQTLSSKVKASIISEYFPQYCNIITKVHVPERIGYFDMFAGPGIYKDGNLSTPILIGKQCETNSTLKNLVWMIFNDKEYLYIEELKRNFLATFPPGSFNYSPYFSNRIFGEVEEIDNFLRRPTYKNRKNECPSILFIDPFGYKHLNTPVLIDFLKSWGNEVFIFINSKRLNADIEKEVSQSNLREVFPNTYEKLKKNTKLQSTVEQKHKFIVDCIAEEFKKANKNIYCTSFEFMEEDQSTISHFLLHITKGAKGFELIKQIYNKYANIQRVFDSSYVTYTFDPKKLTEDGMFDEFFKQENIEWLKQKLKGTFNNQTISALKLFKSHHTSGMYAEKHYRLALRQLADEKEIEVYYKDGKNHKLSVILSHDCILTFK